mgnify:FL=1
MTDIPATDKSTKSTSADISQMDRYWYHSLVAPLLVAVLGAALYIGWQNSDEFLITPEWGTGYWLGITGGVMFLMIFLYPLRKKSKLLRNLGSVKVWFNAHMIFGLLAPTIIIFHSNFQLGATNSNIALYSMLLVVISGLIGRYIYAQIHYGLFGKHADLAELTAISDATRGQLGEAFGVAPVLENVLEKYEHKVLDKPSNLVQSIFRKLMIGVSTWTTYLILRSRIKPLIAARARQKGWSQNQERDFYRKTCHTMAIHLATIRKIAVLNFYERLFAGWHMVHVVFFTMLILSGVFHVFAVHLY